MGALPVSRAVILIMRSGIGSAIINIASTLGKLAVENASAYRASKGELLQLSRAMALDHTKDCTRVNPISRGPVRNEILADLCESKEVAKRKLAHVNASQVTFHAG